MLWSCQRIVELQQTASGVHVNAALLKYGSKTALVGHAVPSNKPAATAEALSKLYKCCTKALCLLAA
jgi:hypothetical protein